MGLRKLIVAQKHCFLSPLWLNIFISGSLGFNWENGHCFLDNFTENWTLNFFGIQPIQGAKNTIYTHPNFCEKSVKKNMIFYFYY